MSPKRRTTNAGVKGKVPLELVTKKCQIKIIDAFKSRKLQKSPIKKKIKDPIAPPINVDQCKVENTDEEKQRAEETKLHQFDLDWEYGPTIGITRLERWERAKKLGLNPPQLVKDMILKSSSQDVNKCVWDQKYNVL